MIRKVAIFESTDHQELEDHINNWLGKYRNTVVSIQYQVIPLTIYYEVSGNQRVDCQVKYSALIYYQEG